MSITYTWKVTGLKTKDAGDLSKAVFQTYWQKIGKDEDGNEGVFSGATPFKVEDIPADNFVPFEELTEEIVLDWIKSVVVGHYEEHVNGQIAKQIAAKTSNIEENVQLPWKKDDPIASPPPPKTAP